jgi:Uma2 family endonuclease
MTTIYFDTETIEIPSWVCDHASFRRWARSEDFPESGRICFINRKFCVDVSKEQFFTHNQLKNEFAFVLTGFIKTGRLGRFVPDGMLLSNVEAAFTTQPDGAFVSREALRSGRVKLIEGATNGFVELEGVPDMVLEIVSDSSVKKDTIVLVDQYWQAGIPEYWLVDAREETIRFDILRQGAKGYTAVRKLAGYAKSQIFNKSFRLTRQLDESGDPEFSLSIR